MEGAWLATYACCYTTMWTKELSSLLGLPILGKASLASCSCHVELFVPEDGLSFFIRRVNVSSSVLAMRSCVACIGHAQRVCAVHLPMAFGSTLEHARWCFLLIVLLQDYPLSHLGPSKTRGRRAPAPVRGEKMDVKPSWTDRKSSCLDGIFTANGSGDRPFSCD